MFGQGTAGSMSLEAAISVLLSLSVATFFSPLPAAQPPAGPQQIVSLTQEKAFGTGHPTWSSHQAHQDGGHSSVIKVAVPSGNFPPSILTMADVFTQTDPVKEEAEDQTSDCRSALDLCRWSQDGVQLLGHIYSKSLSPIVLRPWNVPPSKRFSLAQTAV